MESTTVALCMGPPGTGKTTYQRLVAQRLAELSGQKWLYVDNEWHFTRKMRVQCSRRSGIALDTPEYTEAFGLLGREGYEELIAHLAAQGVNVLATAPYEDLNYQHDGRTKYQFLVDTAFPQFTLKMVYLLLWPTSMPELDSTSVLTDPSMEEIEKLVHQRLFDRASHENAQRVLDMPKLRLPDYYRKRAALVLRTVETCGVPLVKIRPNDGTKDIVDRIAAALIAP